MATIPPGGEPWGAHNEQYRGWMESYGNQYGVPDQLLRNIARLESDWNPTLDNSGVGRETSAQGLMQFVGGAGSRWEDRGRFDRHDPQTSINEAALYLHEIANQLYPDGNVNWRNVTRAYRGANDVPYLDGAVRGLGDRGTGPSPWQQSDGWSIGLGQNNNPNWWNQFGQYFDSDEFNTGGQDFTNWFDFALHAHPPANVIPGDPTKKAQTDAWMGELAQLNNWDWQHPSTPSPSQPPTVERDPGAPQNTTIGELFPDWLGGAQQRVMGTPGWVRPPGTVPQPGEPDYVEPSDPHAGMIYLPGHGWVGQGYAAALIAAGPGITHFPGSGPYGGGSSTLNDPFPTISGPTPYTPAPIDQYAPGPSGPNNTFQSVSPNIGSPPFSPSGGGGSNIGGGNLPAIVVTPSDTGGFRRGGRMPYRSDAQRRWAHTPTGVKALGGKDRVAEWDRASKGMKLPARVDSRGGVVPMQRALQYSNFAMGGAPVMVRPYVRKSRGSSGGFGGKGLINSSVPGRTDKHPMSVDGGSYVLPADIVSGVGESNTIAGAKKLDKLFSQGPYQSGATPSLARKPPSFMPMNQKSTRMIRQRFASGGHSKTDIVVAGGEYLLSKDKVAEIGGGDPERGFAILDAFVKAVRQKTVKTLKGLPGPKR